MSKNETYYEMLLREEKIHLKEIARGEYQISIEHKCLKKIYKEMGAYQATKKVPKKYKGWFKDS